MTVNYGDIIGDGGKKGKKGKKEKGKKGRARLFALLSIKWHKISTGITHLYEIFIGKNCLHATIKKFFMSG